VSKRKDRERAKQFVYRNGQRIARSAWDKYQRELGEQQEELRLKSLGLTRGKMGLLVAEREIGVKKAPKQLITLADLRR